MAMLDSFRKLLGRAVARPEEEGEARGLLKQAYELLRRFTEAPSDDTLRGLLRAIELYKQALETFTEQNSPVDWAAISSKLGDAYLLFRGPNLERAIACYRQALRVYTERDFPAQWATTQNNLGNAYSAERAFPAQWALTQSGMVTVCSDVADRDRGRNLEQAIACYELALRVRTANRFPFECRQTLSSLGNTLLAQERWAQGLETYRRAADLTEQIRTADQDDSDRRRSLHESSKITEGGVHCGICAGQYGLALELSMRGKTRNLTDTLWQRDERLRGVSTGDWHQYQQWLAEVRERERAMAHAPEVDEMQRGVVTRGSKALAELERLRGAIRTATECFARLDRDFVQFARPLGIEAVAALANQTEAVAVEFQVTAEGTYVFLVGPGETMVTRGQVVGLPELTSSEVVLRANKCLRAQLVGQVEAAGGEIYQRVLWQVHSRLRERYPDARRLILIPHRQLILLPLHAAWWRTKDGERRYLLDDYEITYAPSCQVLERCMKREQGNGRVVPSLFAVANPDGSLPFADWEVEEIATLFHDKRVYKGKEATKAAVLENISFGAEKLFSTHGSFDTYNTHNSHLLLHDGKLCLPEIVSLDLSGTWMVVMSACLTGLTDPKDLGLDEYYGLPAAFLVAGAQTVVASLWEVNDVSTALMMRRFHANLYKEKMAKAAALREAQIWLRDLSKRQVELTLASRLDRLSACHCTDSQYNEALKKALNDLRKMPEKPFAKPYYWAAFQCIGAGWRPDESRRATDCNASSQPQC